MTPTIHADAYRAVQKPARKIIARKLTALVRVEYLRLTPPQCRLQRPHAEFAVLAVRQLPKVTELLGAPDEERDGGLIYHGDAGPSREFLFGLKDGVVRELLYIHWSE